jgi:multidrug resistance efflux pump
MLNKKKIRIFIGLMVVVVLFFAIAPKLYLFNSADGVVNGRILTLHSPIEGNLCFSKTTYYGAFYKKDEVIGEIINDRINNSFLYELQTETKTLQARVDSIKKRIIAFSALIASLKKKTENHQKFSQKRVSLQIEQEKQLLVEELTENKRAKSEYESSRFLIKQKAVGQRELEKHEAAFLGSSARLTKIKGRLAELDNSLAAIKTGTFLEEGNNDSPYSKQRLDQLVIEISLAETVYNESVNRMQGIEQQIIEEKLRIKRMKKHIIIAPFDCLVWRMPSSNGSNMVIDSEIIILLKLKSVFLDITVSESEFDNIIPGTEVSFQLKGELKTHHGVVFTTRGSGIIHGDVNFAASLKKDPKKEFRIWAKAKPGDVIMSDKAFSQVGRRVTVKFPRKWSHWNFLNRFIHVF